VPPCVTVSLRKATYSYHNNVQHKAFTISVPSERYVKEADYFGIGLGEDRGQVRRLQTDGGAQRSGRMPLNVQEFSPWFSNVAFRIRSSWGCTRNSSANSRREID